MLYPYASPIIMTDTIFSDYGGYTGTTTAAQRQAAYLSAETKVSLDLETLLLPTIVTGTQYYIPADPFLILDYAYVSRVYEVRFINVKEEIFHTISGTTDGQASLRNPIRGLLDIHRIIVNCGGCLSSGHFWPYQIQTVYEAGLPTGTANHPNILMALTEWSKIFLNEIVGYGNEAPGDIGVQKYKNQEYSEERYPLKSTTFGTSAKAQFISGLLDHWRVNRFVRF